jgi:hypothetical protein
MTKKPLPKKQPPLEALLNQLGKPRWLVAEDGSFEGYALDTAGMRRLREAATQMGAPFKHKWPEISAEIASRVVRKTAPRTRIQFRDQMLEWCSRTYPKEPPASTMLEFINAICDRLGYGRKP